MRVHLAPARGEHRHRLQRAQQLQVAVEVARVGVEVLAGAELGGVDEDAHDGVARGPRPVHQGEVAGVQGAHGGDQHQGTSGIAGSPEGRQFRA